MAAAKDWADRSRGTLKPLWPEDQSDFRLPLHLWNQVLKLVSVVDRAGDVVLGAIGVRQTRGVARKYRHIWRRGWDSNPRGQSRHNMKISVDDIAFSVVFTRVFTCPRSEILDPSKKSPKIFFNKNTFHLIIMMISVVLCKINEEMNYVSIIHNHVVRIWLRNPPAKLSWNRNKNS